MKHVNMLCRKETAKLAVSLRKESKRKDIFAFNSVTVTVYTKLHTLSCHKSVD
jgi:hypothetical protein